jgi:ATP-dependent DNA helicase RecQ
MTPDWLTIAASRTAVKRAFAVSANESTAQLELDMELRDYLREWRRGIAKEQGLPAYAVLHDTTLEEICRLRPTSIAKLKTVTGIGERKAATYGEEILAALRRYAEGARASALPQKKTAPTIETLQLLSEGKTLEEIAQIRGRQLSTVVNSVAALVERGDIEFQSKWIDRNRESVIEAACLRAGVANVDRLKPIKDVLPPEIGYEEIRLVLARLRRELAKEKSVPA